MAPPAAPLALCPGHVDDHVLRAYITTHASMSYCSYCTTSGSAPFAVPFDVFMGAFMVGVGINYQPHTFHRDDRPLPSAVVGSEAVAREILQLAGVSQAELVRHRRGTECDAGVDPAGSPARQPN